MEYKGQRHSSPNRKLISKKTPPHQHKTPPHPIEQGKLLEITNKKVNAAIKEKEAAEAAAKEAAETAETAKAEAEAQVTAAKEAAKAELEKAKAEAEAKVEKAIKEAKEATIKEKEAAEAELETAKEAAKAELETAKAETEAIKKAKAELEEEKKQAEEKYKILENNLETFKKNEMKYTDERLEDQLSQKIQAELNGDDSNTKKAYSNIFSWGNQVKISDNKELFNLVNECGPNYAAIIYRINNKTPNNPKFTYDNNANYFEVSTKYPISEGGIKPELTALQERFKIIVDNLNKNNPSDSTYYAGMIGQYKNNVFDNQKYFFYPPKTVEKSEGGRHSRKHLHAKQSRHYTKKNRV